jgi:hypothetical protein
MTTNVGLIWSGWNTEGNSDKVWGVFKHGGNVYNIPSGTKVYIFWGARGKSMMFKEDTWHYDVQHLISKKQNKGYKEINYHKLLTIWPDFEETLSERFTLFILSH